MDFFPSILQMPPHLLICIFSDEKSAWVLMCVPLYAMSFLWLLLCIFLYQYLFSLWLWCVLPWFSCMYPASWAPWICEFILCVILGNNYNHHFFKYLSSLLLSRTLIKIYQVIETIRMRFSSQHLPSFFVPVWIVSIDMFSH